MRNKRIKRFLASMMMVLLTFNSAVPCYANAADGDGIDEGIREEASIDEINVSESDAEDPETEEDIVPEEPVSEDTVVVEEPTTEENASDEEADEDEQPEADDQASETFTCGDYEYTLADNVATITKYIGSAKEVIIPATLDGYKVVKIGSNAFSYSNCMQISSLKLSEDIEEIESYAFAQCSELASIEFNSNLQKIGEWCFSRCTGLISLKFNSGLKEIGEYAFYECTGITDITLPEGLERIDSKAFYDSQITQVTIPSSIVSLYSWPRYDSNTSAFSGCDKLEKIIFAEGLMVVPRYGAAWIDSLKEVVVPDTVNAIGTGAFMFDSNLTTINLPQDITIIEDGVFSNCSSLSSISIPEKCQVIGRYAFEECISINEVMLPDEIERIEENAFDGCLNLSSVTFDSNLKFIGESAFSGCKEIKNLQFPKGLEIIETEAFSGTQINSIKLPSSIIRLKDDYSTDTDKSAFTGCNNLEIIEFEEGIKEIPSYGLAGIASLKKVILPETVELIDVGAFYYDISLHTINLPNNITSIGAKSFMGCQSLPNITIPVKCQKIDTSTFSGCSNIDSIIFNSSLTEINEKAFLGCVRLNNLVFPEGLYAIYGSAFKNCAGLNSIVFNSDLQIIGPEAFAGCTGIDNLDLPSQLTGIGSNAFQGSKITYIKIPSSITSLYSHIYSAFFGCNNLEKVEFADGIKIIPESSFYGLASVKEVILPETVTVICEMAFYDNINLEKINLPNSITKIEDNAFDGCQSLWNIVIPTGCINIGDYAFKDCNKLETIVIPKSVGTIGLHAFDGDSKLTIYGYANSYAQTYANECGIPFIVLDDEEPEKGDGFDLKQHGYCFANSYNGFNYNNSNDFINGLIGYKIPLERYQEVYGESYTQHIYDQKIKQWNGNCLGMTATAALFYKNKLDFHDYINKGTTLNNGGYEKMAFDFWGKPYFQVTQDSELEKLIERYQIWGESSDYYHSRLKDYINYGSKSDIELYKYIISNVGSKTREPFILVVSWKKDDDKTSCHALAVDSSRMPLAVENGWRRVFLYDPNNPYYSVLEEGLDLESNKQALDRYIDLNIINGQWRMDVAVNSNESKTSIGYDSDGNLLRNSEFYFIDVNDYPLNFDKKATFTSDNGSVTVSYRSDNVMVYNNNDELLYKKANGNTVYINSDIVNDSKYCGYVEGLVAGLDEGMLILPQGQYKVTVDNGMIAFGNDGDYAGVVTDNNQITVTNTATNALAVSANESVSVNIVVMDSYSDEKFSSIQTDLLVDKDGCEVSISGNKLDIDTNDDQKFDVDIITDEGEGEIKDASSEEVEEIDIEDYIEEEGEETEYKITYDLDGGTVSGNPATYTSATETFTLINPTKEGYVFTGWTGSNGDTPEITVVIKKGSRGDLSFKANWSEETAVVISENSAMNPVPVIDADTTEIHLVKGQKFTLAESGWSCADKKILSVSKKNVVTAKKVTTTPVKLVNGERSIDVYITKPAFAQKSVTLQAGSSRPVELNYDSENLPILWYSNAPDVATVSQNGTVSAVAKGTATITAYINGYAYSCKVKVKEDVTAQERTLHMSVNAKKTISIKGLKKVTWTSDDESIVSVAKGKKLTANATGETMLRTEFDGKEYIIKVFVENPEITTAGITSAGKNKYKLELAPGGSAKIEFTAIDQPVVFKSNKGETAYVDADGTIKANKAGKAKLTAKINGKTVTITVTVQ